ncbi:quinone-dependent dihydroorotate dehydrogenase [Neptunomonas phycophila]|jgi:dihydroorotate dehydrogenase|uniref:Dihydroorotate dehydrogenase (quinone) n=1 Tax=Neptunomonas phycophila TaxID=1572645 RepID=A0AAW7XP87_9GAMM|nr:MULTISPECIES: quinone-dependent dihydroorotate dehydrogenase [Neptunomonas]MBT3146425.1 quinone-dependent dihydroorotate dehydrogenase [Neptunomonas phycophila]MDN2658703.1 quinone-dependent dihydroorotate dehydrogenase [Neptunomonas sp. CHC150]MDO6454748.1 quinone-dependent dihydroorotate dehydrogenase [Neptunomonas phycophila]MDO6469102.1 quinone-dependent dihydroorotate dehydrogenase [Neptunomonas phycophila]MDO6785124.1 quinone-dependent dihydroorotate dehydrogenase [Neptunomonas phycop
MFYSLAKSLMFSMDAERSHNLALGGMNLAASLGVPSLLGAEKLDMPVEVMGIRFPNPVGLAAGLDKNGTAIDGLAALGFGFVEIGTVTPRPQVGNPKPRLFRIPEHNAIINRMGFNNHGVDALLANVDRARYKGILGINIGKNKDTPNDKANDDYLYCLRKVYSRASYITVNVSSPNTPGLRSLQFGDSLNTLLESLKNEQARQALLHDRYVPIAVKIAPDMTEEEIVMVADSLKTYEMDGVIATNTTLSREGVEDSVLQGESGGLSGEPVRNKSTKVIRTLAYELNGALPIIGVGGITEGFDAAEKIEAGASLVQIYSGFIYKGPALVKESVRAIEALKRRQ